jgi:hypothetical protein
VYQIIKNVIERGDYDLTAILKKIDTLWASEKLTDIQYNELLDLARGGASVNNSEIVTKLNDLEARVRALEEKGGTTKTDEYPEYVAGKWYYRDDKCAFEGGNYKCIAPVGIVCVWSPVEYPAYWEAV